MRHSLLLLLFTAYCYSGLVSKLLHRTNCVNRSIGFVRSTFVESTITRDSPGGVATIANSREKGIKRTFLDTNIEINLLYKFSAVISFDYNSLTHWAWIPNKWLLIYYTFQERITPNLNHSRSFTIALVNDFTLQTAWCRGLLNQSTVEN